MESSPSGKSRRRSVRFSQHHFNVNMNARTPSVPNIDEGDSSSFSIEKKPIVVVLGWTGSQDRYVQKYCQIYEDLGYATIWHNPPISHAFYNFAPNREKAVELLQLIVGLKGEDPKRFVIHLLSNGGALVYSELVQVLEEKSEFRDRVQMVGTIYDSAPTPPSSINIYQATYGIIRAWGFNPIVSLAGGLLYLVLVALLSPLVYLIPHFRRLAHTRLQMMQILGQDQARCPQLFLYSLADRICPAKIIQEFASQRQRLGVEVTQKCWVDSEHVMHLALHREEYLQHCQQFCQKVFAEQ